MAITSDVGPCISLCVLLLEIFISAELVCTSFKNPNYRQNVIVIYIGPKDFVYLLEQTDDRTINVPFSKRTLRIRS